VRKHLSIILIGSLVFLVTGGQALARPSGKGELPPVEKIKAKIKKLGVGGKAEAQIKLRNGQKLKGHVSSAGEDNFTLTERDSGQTTTVAYADVIEIRKSGSLSTGAKIGIVAGIGVAVTALVILHACGGYCR
jgi:hypothetical protein